MSILIIGSGVVGTQIARLEVERGERPVVMELAPQPDAIAQVLDISKIDLIQGDVLDPLALTRVIREYSVTRIMHTAANPLLTVGAQKTPFPAIQLNVLGTANVLEAARIFNLERVVFSSSSTLYNSVAPPIDDGSPVTREAFSEEMHPRTTTIYSTTKAAAENLGLVYARLFGLDFIAVRYAIVYGPWGGHGGGGGGTQEIRRLIEKGLKGEEAIYHKAPPVAMVYSKDAALGTVLACHAQNTRDRVFNISDGSLMATGPMIEQLNRLIPGSQYKGEESPPSSEPPNVPMDQSRAREQLGYEPQYPLDKALADYVAWTREHMA